MAAHSFKTVQKIPVSLEEAWAFFSDPTNLQKITPANMKFRVITKNIPGKMYPGQIIEYRVSPLMGISLYWMTEISYVENQKLFIDEQRFGPYRFWQHQHHFREIPGGVEMTDIIHYKNPLWFLGRIANFLFVKKKLHSIFEFRRKKIIEIFGKWNNN